MFAGRLIPEKRAPLGVAGVAKAREYIRELRGEFFGDGPERAALQRAIVEHDAEDAIIAPGFVASETIEASMRRALCMLLPSSREGYAMVVVEAAAHGVPSIVIASPDNAATELVEDGVNGFVVTEPTAEAIAEAIVHVERAGPALRDSTARWFAENADRLSVSSSVRDGAGRVRRGRDPRALRGVAADGTDH